MDDSIDITVDFAGLKLANPVFTASGTCGYTDELSDFMDVSGLGGFITKSITLKPREVKVILRRGLSRPIPGCLTRLDWLISA